jgi:hypothetical protein
MSPAKELADDQIFNDVLPKQCCREHNLSRAHDIWASFRSRSSPNTGRKEESSAPIHCRTPTQAAVTLSDYNAPTTDAVPSLCTSPATTAASFHSLPRELRDVIYHALWQFTPRIEVFGPPPLPSGQELRSSQAMYYDDGKHGSSDIWDLPH